MKPVSDYLKSRLKLFILIMTFVLALTSCGQSKATSGESMEETFPAAQLEVSDETQDRINSAQEEGSPTILISNTEANPGESAIVTVNLVNNPGILGMSMIISYDESIMTLEKVQNGDAFDDTFTLEYSDDLASGCSFLWTADDIAEEDIKDGMALALQFQIKDNTVGKTAIHIICDQEGTVDKELAAVNMTVNDGYITIVQ